MAQRHVCDNWEETRFSECHISRCTALFIIPHQRLQLLAERNIRQEGDKEFIGGSEELEMILYKEKYSIFSFSYVDNIDVYLMIYWH